MAHEINYNKVKKGYSFASANLPAWHGLGQVVKGIMTAEEAIRNAHLDYVVEKSKVYFSAGEEDAKQEVEGHYATYRTDTNDFLGLVKSRYKIVQNADAFGFFDNLITSDEAIFETAGALGKGERIFLLAKLPEDFKVGGESIEKYIMLMNSHDGSSSVIAGLTNVRVVCNNTLQAALKGLENRISISHTSNATDKLKEAYKVMKIESMYTANVCEIFNRMTDVKMTEGQYMKFLDVVHSPDYSQATSAEEKKELSTRAKNIIEVSYKFSQEHPTQQTPESQNTLWGAYNAVSGYYNYIKEYKNPEEKFRSVMFGMTQKKVMKAFQECVSILNN